MKMSSSSLPMFFLVLILVVAVLARALIAWLPLEVIVQHYLPDDAFYYFAIARHIVSGLGITVDGLRPTNGFHPLWAGVLLLPYALTNDDQTPIHLALSLGALADGITIWLAWRIGRRLSRDDMGGVLAAAFYAFNPFAALQSINGLETSLSTLFFALSTWFYLTRIHRRKAAWRDAVLFGLIAGLMLLARTDNVLFVIILVVDALFTTCQACRRRLALLCLAGMVAGALILPWLIWNLIAFGTIVQSSAVAVPLVKHHMLESHLKDDSSVAIALVRQWYPIGMSVLFSLVRYGGPGWGALVAALTIHRLLGLPLPRIRILAPLLLPVGGALLILAVHALTRWYVRGWYFVPWAWTSAVCVGPALSLVARRWSARRPGKWLARLGSAVLALVIAGQIAKTWAEPFFPWQRLMLSGARWVANHTPPDTVSASFNSGMHIYFSQQPVINLDGVVNWEAIHALEEQQLMAYIDQNNVRYLVDFDEFIFDTFGPFYGTAPRSRLRRLSVLPDESTRFGRMGVYEILPSPDCEAD